MKPIIVKISKSTGEVVHIKDEVKTVISSLPPQANIKAILARMKAMGLRISHGIYR